MSFTSPKGKEHFLVCQIEVKAGNHPGVYTIATSLSEGEDWINNGMANFEKRDFHMFKIPREWPIYSPQDPKERMLEQLELINPDRAQALREQTLEKDIQNPQIQLSPEEIFATQQQQQQIQSMPMAPRYPQRRRTPYYARRRY